MLKKTILTLTSLASLTMAKANPTDGPYSAQEQALLDKGEIMESYRPNDSSGHRIVHIRPTAGPRKNQWFDVVELNFGREDAEAARAEGQSMAEFHYSPKMAGQFIFAEGWSKYHDPFFTRAYIQEGMSAYNKRLH